MKKAQEMNQIALEVHQKEKEQQEKIYQKFLEEKLQLIKDRIEDLIFEEAKKGNVGIKINTAKLNTELAEYKLLLDISSYVELRRLLANWLKDFGYEIDDDDFLDDVGECFSLKICW